MDVGSTWVPPPGPNSNKDTLQHWTRACDDLKGLGNQHEPATIQLAVIAVNSWAVRLTFAATCISAGAGDIDWFNAKRQLLGVVMNQGGRVDVQVGAGHPKLRCRGEIFLQIAWASNIHQKWSILVYFSYSDG